MLTPLHLKPYTEKKEEFENLSFEIDWAVDTQAENQLYPMSYVVRSRSRQTISLRNSIRVLIAEAD